VVCGGSSGFLADVRNCGESDYGLMDFYVCLGGEGEVGVFRIGICWFVWIVYEIIVCF